ncbi:hypothetical protein PFISCL1PPCAC_2834, partial [Pristionchus fissidentatus]
EKPKSGSTPLTSYTDSERRSGFIASTKESATAGDEDFNDLFRQAQDAIHAGTQPELIPEGSSGSYFVRDAAGQRIAVFKPKDEEPFAPLNPKWPKFFQRVMCFCCFGRACLIPNSGYLSETGASVIDQRLDLNVVPKTRVVKLASSSFYYERRACCFAQNAARIRPKEGSFQTFVTGYEPADHVIARWQYDPSLLTDEEKKRFVYLFQKMIALDYIIRNTDRHMDNWLIRHIPGQTLELAAIDNGLAFPVKHPEVASRLRRFPFKWQSLEWANQVNTPPNTRIELPQSTRKINNLQPWDESLRRDLLAKLTPYFVHTICKEIKTLFRHDIGANRLLVNNQLRMWNLRLALENSMTPADMAKLEPLTVKKNSLGVVTEQPAPEPANVNSGRQAGGAAPAPEAKAGADPVVFKTAPDPVKAPP